MKYQANRNYISNDIVMTPPGVCAAVVDHFAPQGRVMDPCAGNGNFLRAFVDYGIPVNDVLWCEVNTTFISKLWGPPRDFFSYTEKVDWIITNPPWSQIRKFLDHAMIVADNVVFLLTVNHIWTKLRFKNIHNAGFAIKEICVMDSPKELNKSGFTVGCVHVSRSPVDVRGNVSLGTIELSQLSGYNIIT
jgi:hypothetical protein